MQKNNKRILFICPYPLNEAPSQRFRFEQYFDILKKNGFVVKSCSFIDLSTWKILYTSGHFLNKTWGIVKGFIKRMFLLFYVPTFDFIFIHREATPVGPPWFEWIVTFILRKKIIYDFDDSIWLPNTSNGNRIAALFKWHSKVNAICRWSYKVSCGNSYLCSYAKKYNHAVVVNPTTIDSINLHNPSLFQPLISSKVIIGWTGTHSTLKYLDPLIQVFQFLTNKYNENIQFLIIADQPPSISIPNLIFKEWNLQTEIQDLQRMDIGVMPLPNDEWAKGKCGFKALQYMALEIAAVVSPIGVNTSIIENGVNGFLADSTEKWETYLSRLIEDVQLRKAMGKAGRRKIEANYSVASNAANFLSLFE